MAGVLYPGLVRANDALVPLVNAYFSVTPKATLEGSRGHKVELLIGFSKRTKNLSLHL